VVNGANGTFCSMVTVIETAHVNVSPAEGNKSTMTAAHEKQRFGHPHGQATSFFTEMW
jgi:hypothetical protein